MLPIQPPQPEKKRLKKCEFKSCNNNSKDNSCNFFVFPKNQNVAKEWMKLCNDYLFQLKPSTLNTHHHVCSDHFEIVDYQSIFKQDKLKRGSIPKDLKKNQVSMLNPRFIINVGNEQIQYLYAHYA